jgi:hypothetical protein
MRLGRFSIGWLAVAAAALLSGLAHASAALDREYERFFIVTINDQRVGFSRESGSLKDGNLVTSSEMVLQIARADQEMRVSILTEFVETLEGEPVSMRSTTDMGGSETTEAYVWDGDLVKHTTISAARRTVRELPAPERPWLTPGQVGAFIEARVRAGADKLVYSTVDASTGIERVLNTLEKTGTQPITVLGREVEAQRWTVVQSIMPNLTMVNFTDDRGLTLRSELPFGGLNMVMVLSDREQALKDIPPVEVMASTLIKPSGEIDSPRTTRRAVYRLSSLLEGQRLPSLPTTSAQRVERLDDDSLRVTIDLDQLAPADEADREQAEYLEATTAADSSDEAVHALVDRALRGIDPNATDRERAEAMRRFVFRFIADKQLGIGFATASEVARNPAGDCTEHAVLLTAMLRAADIPSRAVNGLIFVDQFVGDQRVFGYHMWTQALIDRDDGTTVWLDLDASWPLAMDATHIATSVTDLSDGSMLESHATIARLLGVLAIEVEEVE